MNEITLPEDFDFTKFIQEKMSMLNKNNIDQIYLEIMETLNYILNKKITLKTGGVLNSEDQKILKELINLKSKFDNKFSHYKNILSKEMEEKEKSEVIISIYKNTFDEISFISEQGKAIGAIIKNNVEKYGRDSRYIKLYKEVMQLAPKVRSLLDFTNDAFKQLQEYGTVENDFLRVKKLEHNYSLAQETFSQLSELKEYMIQLTIDIKNYDLEMQKGIPLSEVVVEEEVDEEDLLIERTNKLLKISEELERKRRKREQENGILVKAIRK